MVSPRPRRLPSSRAGPSSPACSHVEWSPASQERQLSAAPKPRVVQEIIGSTTTRWPTSSPRTCGPVSATRARTSCPSTAGKEPKGSIDGLAA